MKKILFFILSIALVLSLSLALFSCGEEEEPKIPGACNEHKDEDDNGICDVCKQETVVVPEQPTEVSVSFTVKDQDGLTVSGITVAFTEKGNASATPVTAVSGANGQFTVKLLPSTYAVDCDYDVSAVGYYYSDTTEVKVEKNTSALDILLINTTPNGSVDRPYPLSVGDNRIIIPAGETLNFIVYRALNLIASIEAAGIKVTYGGAEYIPDSENKINFAFLGTDTNSVENLKIHNPTSAEISFNLVINSAPGTHGNPYIVEALGVEISKEDITSRDIVYYSYTATESGTLTLTVTSEETHAAMQCNSKQVTTASEDSSTISLDITAGDVVIIDLATSIEENARISFVLAFAVAE